LQRSSRSWSIECRIPGNCQAVRSLCASLIVTGVGFLGALPARSSFAGLSSSARHAVRQPADLLQHQGKYDQAEPLYRRANENPAQGMGSGAG
jgi:hypothetical protein